MVVAPLVAITNDILDLVLWPPGNWQIVSFHDDVIKWKHFPRYCPFGAGNSQVTGEFPAQRPVTRIFDVFFDLRLNRRLT